MEPYNNLRLKRICRHKNHHVEIRKEVIWNSNPTQIVTQVSFKCVLLVMMYTFSYIRNLMTELALHGLLWKVEFTKFKPPFLIS